MSIEANEIMKNQNAGIMVDGNVESLCPAQVSISKNIITANKR